ncbi:MAG: SGNH/GDSL hydrolase family protein [Blastocatellia bacterium]|nr:SGNH/GDSL hydrolase family protein [Blastocatellia bacterium]
MADELRVLFIGNSLTYANDLPAIVEALASAAKQKRFVHKSIAFPNFALEDHWNKGDALKAIRKGGWDIVVMQQGPSASREGRSLLLKDTRRFAEEIRLKGARPALYMVWPSAARLLDFNGVSESYRQAAKEVDGLLLPVGEAWLSAWRLDPELKLYSSDGFHPSEAGSYLAALVIYEQLYGQSPVGLPARLKLSTGKKIEIPEERARLLQEAARDANEKFGK